MKRALLALLVLAAACKQPDAVATPPDATAPVASAVMSASSAAADAGSNAKVELQTKWLKSFAEAFNKHDADAIGKLYSADAVYAELSSEGGESKGREAIQKDYGTEFEGFTDSKLSITRSWHIGDVVAVEYIEGGSGTANDDTEKKFGFTGAHLLWFDAAGNVTRDQIYFDDMTVRVQLGWAEPPLSKLPVRPVVEVPAFTGKWEQNVATGTPAEAKNTAVRDKLYTKLMTGSSENDFLDVVTDDILLAEYDDPADAVGKKGVSGVFADWHKTFSNMRIEATHAWPCGPYVIFEGVFAGKQSGPWGPLKPTNKDFVSHFLDVTRVTTDGKVDRLWTYASSSEILGLRPAKDAK